MRSGTRHILKQPIHEPRQKTATLFNNNNNNIKMAEMLWIVHDEKIYAKKRKDCNVAKIDT